MTNPPTDERGVTDDLSEALIRSMVSMMGGSTRLLAISPESMKICLEAALSHQGDLINEAENRSLRKGLKLGYEMGQEGQSELFNATLASWEREAKEMRQESDLTALISKAEKV